jgi:glycosyltransferase involved in cell wall biosynthesis
MVPSRREFEDTRRESLSQGIPRARRREWRRCNPVPVSAPRADTCRTRTTLWAYLRPVGRLNIEKGMHYAVRALAGLGADAPRARLVIVGTGEEREALEQLLGSLGVEQRIHFVGEQPHQEMAKYLAAADVFLFPTVRGEAAPLVLP